MTPREDRTLDFWWPVFSAPECQAAHCGLALDPRQIQQMIENETVYPLAGVNGGYLFIKRDPFGTVYELHSLFTKPGWGREAAAIGKASLRIMWERGMQVLFAAEIAGLATPPRSYGWKLAAKEFRETPFGATRTWILTRAMWETSPAYKYARN